MKKLLFLLAMIVSGCASATFTVMTSGMAVVVSSKSCADVKTAYIAYFVTAWPGETVTSCSSDPVAVGGSLTFHNPYNGVDNLGTIISITPVCLSGTHLDTSTNTCVDDVSTAIASCLPSIRTISPCPSGYAPTNAIPTGSGGPAPFTSAYDNLPIQDMIFACGMAFCGLLGISVGVKII